MSAERDVAARSLLRQALILFVVLLVPAIYACIIYPPYGVCRPDMLRGSQTTISCWLAHFVPEVSKELARFAVLSLGPLLVVVLLLLGARRKESSPWGRAFVGVFAGGALAAVQQSWPLLTSDDVYGRAWLGIPMIGFGVLYPLVLLALFGICVLLKRPLRLRGLLR